MRRDLSYPAIHDRTRFSSHLALRCLVSLHLVYRSSADAKMRGGDPSSTHDVRNSWFEVKGSGFKI